MIKGQLTLDLPGIEEIGSLDEAKELWDHQQANGSGTCPATWEYVGSGGTRMVFKSPTGVCYKVCYEYDDDDENHNDVEHKNFRRIRTGGRLPVGWRVPRTFMHNFEHTFKKWDAHMRVKKEKRQRVAILACDYIEGMVLDYTAPYVERQKQKIVFDSVGLSDTGGGNAVKTPDGTYYIIDAAEWLRVDGEPERPEYETSS